MYSNALLKHGTFAQPLIVLIRITTYLLPIIGYANRFGNTQYLNDKDDGFAKTKKRPVIFSQQII